MTRLFFCVHSETTHLKMQHWSVHDLRRTMRTNMSAHVPPHVCEIMLGHKLPVVWATYDKYDYLDEQAQAYEAWAVKIKEIELDTSFER